MHLKFTYTMSEIQSGSWLRVRESKKIQRIILIVIGLYLIGTGLWLYPDKGKGSVFAVLFGIFAILWEDVFFRLFNLPKRLY